MKYKAKLSFAAVNASMGEGEVRFLPDDIAQPLLACGYIEAVKDKGAKLNGKKSPKDKPD